MIRQFYKQVLSKLTDVEKIYNTLTWQINVHAYLVTSVPQKSIPSAVVHSTLLRLVYFSTEQTLLPCCIVIG